ncbi:unnamed protein product, partial [Oppiella nova]
YFNDDDNTDDFLSTEFSDEKFAKHLKGTGVHDLEDARRNVRDLLSIHGPQTLTSARVIARILQGIPSPRFPADVWGKCRRFWRADITVNFNDLLKIANEELIHGVDFGQIDLTRGETPADIKDKCLQLCSDYLSGNWKQQTVDTIEVRRISGGLTNQIYYCGITSPSKESVGVPQEVAVRLYESHHFDKDNSRLSDVVVGQLVSDNKLGPKVYGFFEGGQIQAYYKHRIFSVEEQKNPKLVTELFKKLAQIHAMDVPLERTIHTRDLDVWYESVQRNFEKNDYFNDLNLETLKKYDIKVEKDFIKDLIQRSKSPMVFIHHDFRSANIMVLEDNSKSSNLSDGQIVLCDFDESNYGYRGQDFGSLIVEWNRTLSDFQKLPVFPDDSTLLPLIDIYITESERIFGAQYSDDKINSREQILKEVKIFTLLTALLMTLFCLKDEKTGTFLSMDRNVIAVSHLMFIIQAIRQSAKHLLQQISEDMFDINMNELLEKLRYFSRLTTRYLQKQEESQEGETSPEPEVLHQRLDIVSVDQNQDIAPGDQRQDIALEDKKPVEVLTESATNGSPAPALTEEDVKRLKKKKQREDWRRRSREYRKRQKLQEMQDFRRYQRLLKGGKSRQSKGSPKKKDRRSRSRSPR